MTKHIEVPDERVEIDTVYRFSPRMTELLKGGVILGKMPGTITWEDIIQICKEHKAETSIAIQSRGFCGRIVQVNLGIDNVLGEPVVYLKRPIGDVPDEIHSIIRISAIEAISFITEKGFLDNRLTDTK